MSAFQWFGVAAAMAAMGMTGHVANAQGVYQSTAGVAEFNPGTAGATMPPGQCGPAACGGGECGASCGDPACDKCCCNGPTWRAFGEFLLLRPRNEGVEYAVPINGPIAANQVPLQVGPTAVIDPEYHAGFRVGIEKCLTECSSISAAYTYYRNEANDGPATADAPFVLRSMVFHPSSADAATDWATASAHEVTNFSLVDLDYHAHGICGCDCSNFGYFIGARYAHLGQQFNADFADIITASMNTNVDFEGVGLRMGLEGERKLGCGFFATAKADANLMGGEFRAYYQQSDANTPVVVNTSWREARFLTILETELAFGWQTCDGRFRASAGYMISAWNNTVKPSDYISSVQRNHYRGTDKVGDTALIFDGLTGHVELSW